MTKYLAGVLSVIAVGVLLVAYGILAPRTSAFSNADLYRSMPGAMPAAAGMQAPYPYGVASPYPNQYAPNGWVPAQYPAQPYAAGYVAQPVAYAPVPAMQVVDQVQPVRTVPRTQYRQTSTRRASVERGSGRNWKKTAMVIGGSSAAGAGIGGLIGGKKGALIGAAVGGGGATLFEATKR
jgi:hypothetical protein